MPMYTTSVGYKNMVYLLAKLMGPCCRVICVMQSRHGPLRPKLPATPLLGQ